MKLQELFEAEEKSILNTLKRHPKHVKGLLLKERGQNRCILNTLKRHPKHVKGNFLCTYKSLDSLEGAPLTVDGYFDCGGNNLKSFKYSPKTIGDKACYNLNKINSIEGAPSHIGEDFLCFNNLLSSLHNIHKQIKHIGGSADFRYNPIKSHVLGLLLIDGLITVAMDFKPVQNIINKHLRGERDIFACQEELIEAGLEDYAQL